MVEQFSNGQPTPVDQFAAVEIPAAYIDLKRARWQLDPVVGNVVGLNRGDGRRFQLDEHIADQVALRSVSGIAVVVGPQVFAKFLDRALKDAVRVARSWHVLANNRIGVLRVSSSPAPHKQLLNLSLGHQRIHRIDKHLCSVCPAHEPAPSRCFIP